MIGSWFNDRLVRAIILAAFSGCALAGLALTDGPDGTLTDPLFLAEPGYDDSPDFPLDARLVFPENSFGDSSDIPIDTRTVLADNSFADSAEFMLDTRSVLAEESFGTSPPFPMNLTGMNRAWGDSETFTFNDVTVCAGGYNGTYSGAASGTIEAELACDGSLTATFISALGPVLFEGVGTVQPDGTVSGGAQGVTFEGIFDFDDCSASGTWTYAGFGSGTWNIAIVDSVTCSVPTLLVAPSQRNVALSPGSTLFAVSNTGSGDMTWTASVVSTPWLSLTGGQSGVNGGQINVAYQANPDAAARSGTIRIVAFGATPAQLDVLVVQQGTAPQTAVTRFEFSPIAGPYSVNELFPVTLTAFGADNQVATGFNGRLDVSASSAARVAPTYVTLTNGVWSGVMRLDQQASATVLRAYSALGLLAESNPFEVQADVFVGGRVHGRVTAGNPPTAAGGARVWLFSILDGNFYFADSGSDGRYTIVDVSPGYYEVYAQEESDGSWSERHQIRVPAGPVVTQDLHLRSTRQRVLFVGGIMGSTSRSWDGLYPLLSGPPGYLDGPIVLYDGAILGPARDIWKSLHQVLDDFMDVQPVPWDWRLPVEEAWRNYLIDAIDDAKRDPNDKVSIVAHSMGGLLVRAYIQSEEYRGDIDKFVMCGTPNRGAAIIYYIWQGGDTEIADQVAPGIVPLYTPVRDNLFLGIHGTRPPSFLGQDHWMGFVQYYVRGLGDLMPTFRFLRQGNRVEFITGHEQSVLWDLQYGPHLDRMVNENGDPSRVRTKIFLSQSEETLAEIPVGPPGTGGLYSDGVPLSTQEPLHLVFGDGTVLRNSVQVGLSHVSIDASREAKHVELMRVYRDRICEFLTGEPCSLARDSAASDSISPVRSSNRLALSFLGRVRPLLTDPAGAATGVYDEVSDPVVEIRASSFQADSASVGLILEACSNGVYQLDIRGVPGDTFTLDLEFSTAERTDTFSCRGVCKAEALSWTLLVDDTAQPAIQLLGPLAPPSEFASEPADGLTRLTWTPSSGPNVVAYNVYGRADDEPTYTLLGSTPGAALDTGHPWILGDAGVVRNYFVVAVNTAWEESFFTSDVENRRPLVAHFSADVTSGIEPVAAAFADESSGEVTSWAWDFDGDGVIDSTQPDAQFTFLTAGSYTVSLTVGGPEGTDTAIRAGYVTVEPVVPPPAPVPGDADGDFDVDLDDFAIFAEAMLGPDNDPETAGWHLVDFEADYDVDLGDFAEFQIVVSGVAGAVMTSAVSRKTCDISLSLDVSITSEPRQGGVSEVRIVFETVPGGPGSTPVTIEEKVCPPPGSYAPYAGASTSSATVDGKELVLTFKPALENGRSYRINIGPEVTSLSAQSVEVRALVGDVNSDGRVNASDRSVVVGVWTSTNFSCETDLDGNGRTHGADRSNVVGAWTSTENCAP